MNQVKRLKEKTTKHLDKEWYFGHTPSDKEYYKLKISGDIPKEKGFTFTQEEVLCPDVAEKMVSFRFVSEMI